MKCSDIRLGNTAVAHDVAELLLAYGARPWYQPGNDDVMFAVGIGAIYDAIADAVYSILDDAEKYDSVDEHINAIREVEDHHKKAILKHAGDKLRKLLEDRRNGKHTASRDVICAAKDSILAQIGIANTDQHKLLLVHINVRAL